jgi:thiol-disulfide isomerase/thioredoxin
MRANQGRPARLPGVLYHGVVPARWTVIVGLLAYACAGPQRAADEPPILHALLLNGGGSPRTNYYSHVMHLSGMHDALRAHGVETRQIDVLSADGDSTEPDLSVVRLAEGRDAWLLAGTTLERPLGRPVRLVSAQSPKITFSRATVSSLQVWFGGAGRKLRAGDTLLLFVTDHGERGTTPLDNRITLWDRESITVRELGGLLETLPRGVRVVTVMSQCFSGGFAELALQPGPGASGLGATCGYFSTTADRMASGCYPQSNGPHDGYAWRFIRGLERTAALPAAHAEALVTDRTPDVPLRSSDLFLARLVERAAARRQLLADQLVNDLAGAALDQPFDAAGLIQQVSHSFAIPVPRESGALGRLTMRLDQLKLRLEHSAGVWESAAGELAQANLEEFLSAQSSWNERLVPTELARLQFDQLAPLQQSFVAELSAFTRGRSGRYEELSQGHNRQRAALATRTRSEVRVAALLRLRALLTSVVGQSLLASEGSDQERADFEALRRCEAMTLPRPAPGAPEDPQPRPFPSIESDESVAVALTPRVLGAALTEVPASMRRRPPSRTLPAGAMSVLSVDRDSPAAAAGLQPGDVLLGDSGEWVRDRGAMKLRLAIPQGHERQLDVVRAGRTFTVRLNAGAAAAAAPNRTAPQDRDLPAAGRAALRRLTAFRGGLAPALAPGRPYLLFFWATWCTVCKLALPELQALERQRGLTVISVSDEGEPTISDFLDSWTGPFPQLVARDPERRVNEAFEVDGYPTFVLVDPAGRVNMRTVGYRPENGLPIPGWTSRQ